jgi:hypothetical protein
MFDYEIAFFLHEARLREAEQERLCHQVARTTPPCEKGLLVRLGTFLAAMSNWLRVDPCMPARAVCPASELELKQAR